MTRKEAALIQMVKRGGTLNERLIAVEKLKRLTGKDYSGSLPTIPKAPVEATTLKTFISPELGGLLLKIRSCTSWTYSFPDMCWVGDRGKQIIYSETLEELTITDKHIINKHLGI